MPSTSRSLGSLVPETAAGSRKLRDFSRRNDVVLGILKRDKMESPDRVFMGTAITNLTRMDFPTHYGPLELERLIMKPGGAFPLANVNMLVGAVTAAGRLSLAVEYVYQASKPSEFARRPDSVASVRRAAT